MRIRKGFLRSDKSLIQTAGRAARNVLSKVILYADKMTGSMQRMIEETERRREIQIAYNTEHGIIPRTVKKSIDQIREGTAIADERHEAGGPSSNFYDGPDQLKAVADPLIKYLTDDQKRDMIKQMKAEMMEAASSLDFERAAELRDTLAQMQASLK